MALTIKVLDRIDPHNFTGPVRQMSGVGRTLVPVADTAYGEFMRWIYVGVTGNLSYVKWDGTTETLIGLAAGVFHPILSIMVNSVGTTATSIVVGS
jgi:hypothetical protein